jgi:hypothetical protein
MERGLPHKSRVKTSSIAVERFTYQTVAGDGTARLFCIPLGDAPLGDKDIDATAADKVNSRFPEGKAHGLQPVGFLAIEARIDHSQK